MNIFDEYKPRSLEDIADSYRNIIETTKEDLIKLEKKHEEIREDIYKEESELHDIHRELLDTIETDLMSYDDKNKLYNLTKERLELSVKYFNQLLEMIKYTYISKITKKSRIVFIQSLLVKLELNDHIKYT